MELRGRNGCGAALHGQTHMYLPGTLAGMGALTGRFERCTLCGRMALDVALLRLGAGLSAGASCLHPLLFSNAHGGAALRLLLALSAAVSYELYSIAFYHGVLAPFCTLADAP